MCSLILTPTSRNIVFCNLRQYIGLQMFSDISLQMSNNFDYHRLWLLGTCTYDFRRKKLEILPYLLSTCAYNGC